MENFRQQFLLESVETLENISRNLKDKENLSEAFKREVFRTLHTIKGTAQTFGFSSSSRLAHELENLLARGEISDNLFFEGIELLVKSLKQKDFEIPNAFKVKIGSSVLQSSKTGAEPGSLLANVPNEFTSQLSNQEKAALHSTLQNGKNLFCFEIGFDLTNFADGLINFREILNESGEIIATLPSAKFSAGGKIGFQILFATSAEISTVKEIAGKNAADLIFDFSPDVFPNDAVGVLALVIKHGKETAEKLGRQIDFKTSADEIKISPQKLKIIFDALLHLVRNAVDHAVETTGKIEIILLAKDNNLNLIVADDGIGVDLEKIKSKAVEKNLIGADGSLTEQETIDLIFLPEFSTKSSVTEISGRGVGLDAVKFAVEKAGGEITVKSRMGKGTTFEIRLPQ